MTLEGKQLGRYHILRLLGSGGMGEVYLAEDPRIGQQVAIKVIRAELTPYPNAQGAQTAARLFQREARAIVALDHPHILPLNDYGEEEQGKATLIYLVMPYRPEGSLADWVRQQYPDRLVPPDVVAHVVSQAAEALQHAHDHQIIHSDVKPSNFLIRTTPKTPILPDLFLADFGIARIASATASTSQAIRGTPTYMSPEQCMGKPVTASDQYALAIMAYELLVGHPPFQGNQMQIMFQHVNTSPDAPSAINPHLSAQVDEVLLTALAKRPEERFHSVTAFARAFYQAVQALEVANVSTWIRAAPLPGSHEFPDVAAPIDPLADATTKMTPPTDEGSSHPIISAPDVQVWAASTAGQPAGSLPETSNPGRQQGRDSIPASLPHRGSGKGRVPDVPSLPEVLPLERGGSGERVESAPSQLMIAPVPTLSRSIQTNGRQYRGKRRFILIAAVFLVIIVLLVVSGAFLPLGSSATVTINPASQKVSHTYTISAVTGTPVAANLQVEARLLSVSTQAYMQTVNATGQETVPASHARGTLEITNDDPNAPKTFVAGTSYPNNASLASSPPKVDMVLDQTVTVPANRTAYVPGHVLQTGTVGNFSASGSNGYFNFQYAAGSGCPSLSGNCWFVESTSAFTGGQDPYNGPAVQQSDIDGAVNSINKPDPQQVLQNQIKSNEQFVGAPQCTPNITSDHKAGDRVAQVTVSVTFTCTGEVYDHDGTVQIVANLLTQQAATDPGGGYTLVGKIKTTITNATADSQGTVTLTVSAEGIWAYQFTQAQQQALARLIAGKSQQDAQQLLMGQPGVVSASIKLSGLFGNTLPSDPSKIKIVVQMPQGA